jgi:hypothetical protein
VPPAQFRRIAAGMTTRLTVTVAGRRVVPRFASTYQSTHPVRLRTGVSPALRRRGVRLASVTARGAWAQMSCAPPPARRNPGPRRKIPGYDHAPGLLKRSHETVGAVTSRKPNPLRAVSLQTRAFPVVAASRVWRKTRPVKCPMRGRQPGRHHTRVHARASASAADSSAPALDEQQAGWTAHL